MASERKEEREAIKNMAPMEKIYRMLFRCMTKKKILNKKSQKGGGIGVLCWGAETSVTRG